MKSKLFRISFLMVSVLASGRNRVSTAPDR
jgi:hypothetical protein